MNRLLSDLLPYISKISDINKPRKLSIFGTVKRVKEIKGAGKIERIYHFTDLNRWVKLTGHYSSYYGITYFDDCLQEVEPKKVTVEIWE